MPKIRNLRTTQIRIFPIDDLPFGKISTKSNVQRIARKYSLDVQVDPLFDVGAPLRIAGPSIRFANGSFEYQQKSYVIENLNIEDRRILLTVNGPTEVCDEINKTLTAFFAKIDPREEIPAYSPILTSNETNCVATMGFSVKDLMAGSKLEKASEAIADLQENYGCHLDIFPSSFKFRVSYLDPPAEITKRKINIVDKEVVLEIRAKSAVDDRMYFTSSPSCSTQHLKLLDRLESIFA